MNETTINITGNLVADPELRYTPSGHAVANFRIASTARIRGDDGKWADGDTIFVTVNAWRQLGENVAETASKGTRVMVTGRLKQRTYETREGEKRTVWEIDAYDVGVSLQRVTAKTSKTSRSNGGRAEDDEAPF
jgi:single-strand DNA-binding protein